MSFDNSTYQSPFSWRYGSQSMRTIWSESHKRKLMRQVWIALAEAQRHAGLVSEEQLSDLKLHQGDVDIERSSEIEREVKHDVIAELRTFAEQCPLGGAVLHWGSTSADITDNVDALRMREAVGILISTLGRILSVLADRIEAYSELPVIGYTHLQPAEPTTLGYRLSMYGQDLLEDLSTLQEIESKIQGKGFKGAVGTQATFVDMLVSASVSAAELEAYAMDILKLPYYPIAGQVYPRKQDYQVLSVLAGLAASLHKFALDFRLMQSPAIGEWAEPFGQNQSGSSAMPFKRNPIISENICSLARFVSGLPAAAWENAGQSMLERSLDDSANRRIILPEAFLAVEQCLLQVEGLLTGMTVNQAAISRNLDRYGQFSAVERVLTALVAAGANRQEAHEWLQSASMASQEAVNRGDENPLPNLLRSDDRIGRYLALNQLNELLSIESYTGTAAERGQSLAKQIRYRISPNLA